MAVQLSEEEELPEIEVQEVMFMCDRQPLKKRENYPFFLARHVILEVKFYDHFRAREQSAGHRLKKKPGV